MTFRIVIGGGQSNMAGQGAAPYPSYSNAAQIKKWAGGAWVPAVEPLIPGYGAGLLMQLANRIAINWPGDDVGIVNVAVGGSTIARWRQLWNTANYYGNLFYQARMAKAAMPGSEFALLAWWQGESDGNHNDATADPNNFLERTSNVLSRIRADLNAPELPIVSAILNEKNNMTPNPGGYNNWPTIRAQQQAMSARQFAVVSTDTVVGGVPTGITFQGPGFVHATTAGYVVIGDKFADAAIPMME
jgi:hypothetical protein